jgi:hypothetical protein
MGLIIMIIVLLVFSSLLLTIITSYSDKGFREFLNFATILGLIVMIFLFARIFKYGRKLYKE